MPSERTQRQLVPSACPVLFPCEDGAGRVALEPARARPLFRRNAVSEEPRRSRRTLRRQLFCPAHPEQLLGGGGRRYFLHLESAEELSQRGMPAGKARLVIAAYPVLTLSDEWLEELFCPLCGSSRWCHVTRHNRVQHTVRWAARDLWQQVAHVDPLHANPSVSEYSRREAGRRGTRRYREP